jgi:hypothetical protein
MSLLCVASLQSRDQISQSLAFFEKGSLREDEFGTKE